MQSNYIRYRYPESVIAFVINEKRNNISTTLLKKKSSNGVTSKALLSNPKSYYRTDLL